MRARKALSWAVWLIAPLVLLEMGARLLLPPRQAGLLAHRPIAALYPNLAEPERIFEEVTAESLERRPFELFAMKPGLEGRHFSTNALGLRGPETSAAKPEGVFRIAVLGGSAAWGYGSSSDAATVPAQLQSELESFRSDLRIEILNAAQPGYVSTQELIFFHREVAKLEPDLVLLLDGYNDIVADMINGGSGLPQNAGLPRSHRQDVSRWLRRSRFFDAAASALLSSRSAKLDFPDPGSTAAAYVANVKAISKLATPARIVAAQQPSLASTSKPLAPEEERMLAEKEAAFPGYTEFVRAASSAIDRALDEANVERIELDDALGDERRLMFADECHFGDEAASMLAMTIAEALTTGLP
jgi:lysophospholipase L1-like esterase